MKSLKFNLLLGLLLLGLATFFFRDEVMGRIQGWRYRQAIEDAQIALEKGDNEEVARLTGAALRLSGGRIEEIRELFDLASAAKSSDSWSLGEALFSHPDRLASDRLTVLEFFEGEADPLYLDGLLSRLGEKERSDPGVIAIRIRQLLSKGNRLEALVLIDSLSQKESGLASLQLLKARLLAGERGNPLAWQSCRQLLGNLIKGPDEEVALKAFRALFLLPDSELKKAVDPDLQSWIEGISGAEPSDHLAVAHWQLLVAPGKENEVIQDVLEIGKHAPDDVARWMLAHRQEKLILEQDLDLESEDSFPFFLARLQLYFGKEQWTEAEVLLRKPHRKLSPSLLSGLRSGIAWRKGDEVTRLTNLQKALDQAERAESFGAFLALFEIGKRLGDRGMQRKACEELVRLPARFLPGGQKLGFLDLEFGGEPEFLASLYQKLAAAKPDDALIVYRKAVIDFIVSGESEAPLKQLELLLADYPGASSIRCAKALILSKSSVNEALTFLEGDVGDALDLDGAFERAVYSSLLYRNGQVERAERLEKLIDWASLPEYLRSYFKPQRAS